MELVQQEKANIEIFQWNWPGTFRANPKREKEGMMMCSATSQQMMSLISTAPPPVRQPAADQRDCRPWPPLQGKAQ